MKRNQKGKGQNGTAMDALVKGYEFVEEKLVIKQFVLGKQGGQKWTKSEIKEATALLGKHAASADHNTELYYLVELHKMLLVIEPAICLEIGENLLKALSSPLLDSTSKRVAGLRNNCYAYLWNFMRLETRKDQHQLNLGLCFLALKFSLLHNPANLSSVINKLQQASQFIQKLPDSDALTIAWVKLFETLEAALSREYGGKRGAYERLSADGLVVLEDCFVQILLLLPRHFAKFAAYKGLKDLCQKIRNIAQIYVPMQMIDLAITFVCKSDADFCIDNLAKCLHTHPSLLTSAFGIYDVFEYGMSQWKNWGQQWISLKKDNPDLEMVTVLNKLEEANLASDQIFVCKALRCEINSYFCSKAMLPDGLLSAGEALKSCSRDYSDLALANLAQGIGFWFGDQEHEADALKLCETAVRILGSSKTNSNPSTLILAAVSYTWIALNKQRQMQTRSTLELEKFQEVFKAANPPKNKDTDLDLDDDTRSIPAISTLTLADEFEIAGWLKKSVDIMSTLIQQEDKIKAWVTECCPSLVAMTMRLLAHLLTTLKDSVNSIRAWYVVFTLSSHFPNKLSRLVSGAELIKQVPDLDPKLVAEIETSFKETWITCSEPIHKSVRPYLWRLEIAKATNALFTKNYEFGLDQLLPILHFRLEKDNHDISHHILAELYFLIAEYISLDVSHKVNLNRIPESIRNMSPASLSSKAFKHLAGMARAPNFRQSGWSDILYNAGLISSMTLMAPRMTEMLKLGGRIREMRVFASDFIFMFQELGLVTSAMRLLIPLAESDLVAKSFDSCELKIIGLHKLLFGKIEAKDDGPPLRRQNIIATLKKCGITSDYKKLVIPDQLYPIASIYMPDWHYTKGERNEEKALLDSPVTVTHKFRVPNFLFHSLKCNCYICAHPVIIPSTVQYLQILACYAKHSRNSTSKDLIRAASVHHMRGMFRIVHNLPKFQATFTEMFNAKAAESAFNAIYLPFFFVPLVKSFLTRMGLYDTENMDLMLNAHKYYRLAYTQTYPKNLAEKHRSFEVLTSAIFCFLYNSPNPCEIEGSEIRKLIIEGMNKVPPEFANAISPERPPEPVVDVCPGPPRKGARRKPKTNES